MSIKGEKRKETGSNYLMSPKNKFLWQRHTIAESQCSRINLPSKLKLSTAGVATVTSDKADFKLKLTSINKDGRHILIMEAIHQEVTTIFMP